VRGSVEYRRAEEPDREGVFAVLRSANFDRVPSPEMPDLDLDAGFVACDGRSVVGFAGYRVVAAGTGKTTLMAVLPAYRGLGVGRRLHELRLDAMRALGCTTAVTNADLPETIAWYKRNFGYREVGTLRKLHAFGAPEVDRWTTLELDLAAPRTER
jgi:predicted N-acetyltransferase YhbS